MVQEMRLIAVVLILAALAYILYLWSKRKDQIECPACGARVNIYAEECPHCGHKKGEPVEKEPVETEAQDMTGQAISTPAPEESASTASEPTPEPDTDVEPDITPGPEEPEEPDAPEPAPEPVSAESESTDYEEVVQGTIAEVKKQMSEDNLDPQKVLDAEKDNQNRVTLIDWLEEQLAQQ